MDNRLRCQVAGDLLVFCWSLSPIVQLFSVLDLLPDDKQLIIMGLLDALSKVGVIHIMLKNRTVIERCNQYAAAEPGRLQ